MIKRNKKEKAISLKETKEDLSTTHINPLPYSFKMYSNKLYEYTFMCCAVAVRL